MPLSCSKRLQHFSQIYVKFLSHRDTAFVSFAVAENFDIHRHTGYTILSRDHYYLLYRHTIYDNIFRRHSTHTHSITHTHTHTHTHSTSTHARAYRPSFLLLFQSLVKQNLYINSRKLIYFNTLTHHEVRHDSNSHRRGAGHVQPGRSKASREPHGHGRQRRWFRWRHDVTCSISNCELGTKSWSVCRSHEERDGLRCR